MRLLTAAGLDAQAARARADTVQCKGPGAIRQRILHETKSSQIATLFLPADYTISKGDRSSIHIPNENQPPDATKQVK